MSKRDLITIRRQILEAQDAARIERERQVLFDRERVRIQLGSHGLFMASFATSRDPGAFAYSEFKTMADTMESGGFHNVRKGKGRNLDG
jgi:hypothetical protein